MRSEFQLAKLRSRTDQDLAKLFNRLIGRSFQARWRGDLAQAERECVEASKLLPLMRGLPGPSFQSLSTQLAELEADLNKRAEACALIAG